MWQGESARIEPPESGSTVRIRINTGPAAYFYKKTRCTRSIQIAINRFFLRTAEVAEERDFDRFIINLAT
jgi:hypothetical protein